jgi:hypothetical protein
LGRFLVSATTTLASALNTSESEDVPLDSTRETRMTLKTWERGIT